MTVTSPLSALAAALLLLSPRAATAQQAITLRRADLLKRVADTAAIAAWRVVRPTGVSRVAGAAEVTLRPGEVVVVPTAKTATPDSAVGSTPDTHVDLPNRYLTPDRSGTRLLTLTIRVAAEGGGLAFDTRDRSFNGVVLIGLEDSMRRTERIPLGGMIELQLTSDVARVDPPTIRIDHTNIPWKRVQVFARNPRDTVHLRIQAVFDPEGYAAPIPVERPRLDVRPAALKIEGLGLEVVKLTVTVPEFLRGGSLAVSLSSDRGGLDAATLTIPPTGTAETSLRSRGLGTNTIHASLSGIATGDAAVTYTFPWSFLIAALLGSVLGTLIARRDRHRARVDIGFGILTGLLSALAYAIGLNLTGLDINVRVGEAAVLVVAALGAAFDLPGLAPLRKRLARPPAG